MSTPYAHLSPILQRMSSLISDAQSLLHAIYDAQGSLASSYGIEWAEDGEMSSDSTDANAAIDAWCQLDSAGSCLRAAHVRLLEAQKHVL